jgi:hypothetical protein
VQLPRPDGRAKLGSGVHERAERPPQDRQIGKSEVGAETTVGVRALQHPLEQLAQLGSRALDALRAGRGTPQHVLEHAIARLQLEHLLEKPVNARQASGSPAAASAIAVKSPMRRSKTASMSASREEKCR